MTEFDSLVSQVPSDIRKALAEEYRKLESRFSRGDWEPASLSGGRFAEAVLRFLEWKQSGGTYTPIGTQLNRSAILSSVRNDTSVPEGLRFNVSRLAELLMDFRNKRDIAHLGSTPDVKEMDARLIMASSSWIMAEIAREESGSDAGRAQDVIDKLSKRAIPLVEEIGGELIVLATDLPAAERLLVALYRVAPGTIGMESLQNAVGYENRTRFRSIVRQHVKNRMVHLNGSNVRITSKGVAWVEANIPMELAI